MIGTLLDERYRVDSELGRGGMGVVYGAHDTLLDRPVAVKVLPAVGVSREGKSRLMREAKATARLNHPHIVSVYDAGETNGSPFIVMELVEGKTLREASAQSLVDSLNLIRQVCDALEHAHNAGIIHRDLKPENVIITTDRVAKLMDFGLALAIDRSHATEPGTLVGTFAYLAPELVMGQEALPQSDLYALGVMLYELTTGRAPFVGDTLVAVISQHLNAPVVPPRTYNASIPTGLEQIIVRLLAKTPGERYGSAAEVLQALDKVQAELTGSIQLPVRVAVQTAQVTSGAILLDRMVRGRMVGRDKELAELRDFWNRAERGEGHMALLSGEPGIGKTRLAEELVVHARLRGALILKGHFHPELGLPYLGIREALRDYLRSRPPEAARADIGSTAPELVKLVPEVAEIVGEVAPNPPMSDLQAEQIRMFDHVTQFLLGLASRSPMLLVLDDLHWADEPSLRLIHYLLRNAQQSRVLVLGTYRETELDPVRPFYESLVGLNRERLYTRVILRRLPEESVGALVEVLLDGPVDSTLVEVIARETEGNPFFVEEVVKSLVEQKVLRTEGEVWMPVKGIDLEVPQSIQVALGKRLAGLSEDAQSVLSRASVLGREFNLDVLLGMGDWDEDHLLDALDEAVKAQLIAEVKGGGKDQYTFAHALLVQVLYESINTRRQARLHQKAGESLEKVYARRLDDQVEQLAYHFSLARISAAEKAVTYSLRAAEKASAIYAYDQAARHYTVALETLADSEDADQEAKVWELLGDTRMKTFITKEAISAYEKALARLEDAGRMESQQVCQLCFKLGDVIARENRDPARARRYLERALALAEQKPDSPDKVKCLAALVSCLVQENALEPAFEQAQAAMKLAEVTGQSSGVATACGALCKVYEAQGDIASYMTTAQRQIAAFDERNSYYDLFEAFEHIGSSNMLLARYADGEQAILEGLKAVEKLHAPGWEIHLVAPYSWILAQQGRWSELMDWRDRILPNFQRVGCDPCFAYIFGNVAGTEARRGHTDEARGLIDDVLMVWRQLERPNAVICWRFFAHVFLEEWDQAWAVVEESRAQKLPQIGVMSLSVFMWSMLVPEAAVRIGRWEEAISLAQETLAYFRNPEFPAPIAHSHFALGLAYAGQKDWDKALAEYEQALNRFQELGHRWDVANTQYEIGLLRVARQQAGDRDRARELFNDSLDSFHDLGAVPGVVKVEAAIGNMG